MTNGKCKCVDCPYCVADDIKTISKQVIKDLAEEFFKIGFVQKNECKKCGHNMIRDGDSVLLSLPAQYPYKCEYCGHTENSLR